MPTGWMLLVPGLHQMWNTSMPTLSTQMWHKSMPTGWMHFPISGLPHCGRPVYIQNGCTSYFRFIQMRHTCVPTEWMHILFQRYTDEAYCVPTEWMHILLQIYALEAYCVPTE